MGDIRKMTTEDIKNSEVRRLMEKFWDAYDKLYDDMDNLTYEEFKEREHEMWGYRNRASAIDGDYFLISLWGMVDKANKLYGEDKTRFEIDNLPRKGRKPIINVETGEINLKYSMKPESTFKWYMKRFWKKVIKNIKKIF